jgi:hypothetical protein
MVEEFSERPRGGASETLSPGFNERSVNAREDTATSAAEQSSAMTPTAEPSEPGGQRGAPDYLIWSTALALLALSIVLPAVMGGGWMWLLTAVMVPLLAGWMVLQWLLRARGERVHLQGSRPMIAIVGITTFGVVAFCAVVALAFQH